MVAPEAIRFVDDVGPTVGDLITKLANEIPQNAAILSHGRPSLSYAALAQEIVRLRENLNGWGIGRGDRVALVVRSRAEALVATLCVSVSATAVPLSSDATSSELRRALALLKPRALIVCGDAKAAAEAARHLGIAIIRLHTVGSRAAGSFELSGDLVNNPARYPGPAHGADNALILMTSGTTSRPKVIACSHALIRRRGETDVAAFELTSSDRCYNFRPTHLAGSLNSALVASLLAAGAVVIPSEFDPDIFYRDLREFNFTWYAGAPVHHEAILARAPYHGAILARSSLRFVRAASYRLPGDLLRRMEQTLGAACLERYGGTEAGLVARNPRPPGIRRAGTVGVPFDCEVAIVDAEGRHLEAGREGEIVVRGPNVFSGYENDTELNATVFLDGWYKTGDLGRFDEDGFLSVCGRIREVINRGGQKISPEEVETVLAAYPGVRDCICFPVPHRTLGETVGAAVVVRSGFEVQESAIRDYVRDRLSRFKVPDRIVTCDQIPRSSLGKPQRTTAAAVLGILTERTHQIPLKPGLVSDVAAVWCETLRVSGVGEHDNFFLVGGDSLQAIRLVVNIEKRFGVRLPATFVFDGGTTVAEIAKAIEKMGTQVLVSSAIDEHANFSDSIPRRDPEQPCPLTYSQEQVLFLSRVDPTGHLYNLSGATRIRGQIDIGILSQAVNALLARHEILRASFPSVNGVPQQVFAPSLVLDIPISDLRHLPATQREEELIRLAKAEAAKPYDLEKGPLIRCRFVLMSDEESALLLPKHHLISDGASYEIFYRELITVYADLANGRVPSLSAVQVQYGDFAVWQRLRQNSPTFARLLDYWRATLRDVRSAIELPFDRPRPRTMSYRGSKVWVSFADELVERLRGIGASQGTSLYTAMLAAFAMFIYRITGQGDFIIGVPVDGRRPGQTDNLLGFFIDTLPLPVQVTSETKYTNLLSIIGKGVVGALQHHEVPFARLVQDLKLLRDTGLPPLIQVMFGFLPKNGRVLQQGETRFERLDLDLNNARFDFLMMLEEEAGTLQGFVEYSTDLFDETTIVRLIEVYRTLLTEIVLDPDQEVGRLPLLSPEGQKSLAVACRGTEAQYPEAPIHELFAEIAKQRPDTVAIVNGEMRLTYQELNVWSDHLAQRLGAEGVGRETVVGILSHRCPELIVGLLAILKAGGVYLPLDAALPDQRLQLMLEEAKAFLCLVPPGQTLRVKTAGVRSIPIVHASVKNVGVPSDQGRVKVTPDDLAYIVFTSGSTGRPKGVCVPHRGVVRLVKGADYIDFGPNEVFLQFAPVTFDAATFEIWGCLLNGGTLVQPREAMPSLSELARVIENDGITTLWLGAGLFHQLVDYKLDCFRTVRQVVAGGDVLSSKHVKRFIETFPDCRLVNGYGPTENTTFTCTCTITTSDILEPSVPIGRPIANTHVYILDEKQTPVPVGIVGELYAAGDGLARGYLNQPGLTAERFVADPFDTRGGAKMYRTGDQARLLANGMIQFVGRLDSQVKIRGFRVEPGEIDAALREHAKVKDCAVLAKPDVVTGTTLVAYIEPERANDLPDSEELRRHLEERLPNYMIPAKFIMVESLPLTKNGKLDRAGLQTPCQVGSKSASAPLLPRTPIEKILGDIWCELLGLEAVGVDDNFFDLGGHSLIATQMTHRVWQELGEELPLRAVFEKPTIESLALVLVERMLVAEHHSVPRA